MHPPPPPPPRPAERAALLEIKKAVDPGNKLSSWGGSTCQCSGSWAGVACTGGLVTSL